MFSTNDGRGLPSPERDRRLKLVTALAAAGYFCLLFRLFVLQIIRGPEMHRLAEQNRTQVIPLTAPRGLVLDRKGDVLLESAPRFSLFYSGMSVPPEASRSVVAELSRWFPDRLVLLRRRLAEAGQSGKMTRLLSGIPRETALALIERRFSLPGVNVVAEPHRRARYGSLASHLLGYVDEIDAQELKSSQEEGYRLGQFIGKTGVERMYDSYLRGRDGGLQFEMDAAGRHVQVMSRIPSSPGADVRLTVDRNIQMAAEKGLKASPTGRGAAVAIDPRTGEILALASSPDFDPTAGVAAYLADPGLPFFNRALQGTYPPGSVFKIVTAAAGLEHGWDIEKSFFCKGFLRLGTKEFGCWERDGHGRRDFMGAVAWSCNVYFYNLGLQVGPDFIEAKAKELGLGEKTGIDLPGEVAGVLPGREWKRRIQGAPWFDGDTLNFAIGQGAVVATPLQMAAMVSSVANGGDLWRPYVLDRVVSPSGETLLRQAPRLRRRLTLSQETISLLRRAMEGVAASGTARIAYRPDLTLGAKTGTAQNPHGEDHAWFAAYAGVPGEPLSLAVVVFVEHGGKGSAAAGPVAREIIAAAFPRAPEERRGIQIKPGPGLVHPAASPQAVP